MTEISASLDYLTAVWLSALVLSWYIRLKLKIPGRLTSWGGFTIVFNGVILLRWPDIYNISLLTDNQNIIRLVVYILVTTLHVWDWWLYFQLTEADKIEIRKALDLIERKGKKCTIY